MTDVGSVDQDDTVIDAAGDMLRQELRHLLVTNYRGEVVGVLSLRDVMDVLLAAMDPEAWATVRHSMTATTHRLP